MTHSLANAAAATASSCPEKLPVVYIHSGPKGDVIYSDKPVLVVHVDDNVPHDRIFVRVADPPPGDLIHGPIACTAHGGPDNAARKERMVAWLKRISVDIASLVKPRAVH